MQLKEGNGYFNRLSLCYEKRIKSSKNNFFYFCMDTMTIIRKDWCVPYSNLYYFYYFFKYTKFV